MKAHETWDESVVGAHVAGNGFDEPRTASCGETATRLTAARANAQVRAAQLPTSGVLPVPSTRQAHQFWHFFFLLLLPDAGEPGMGHHRECNVPIPTVPEAYFILIQSRFSLGLFNTLLHGVALARHVRQGCQRTFCRSVRQIIGDLFGMADPATCQQPDIRTWKLIPTLYHQLSCPVIGDGAFCSLDRCHAFPCPRGKIGDHFGDHAGFRGSFRQPWSSSWSSPSLLLWRLDLGSLGPDSCIGRDCQHIVLSVLLDR